MPKLLKFLLFCWTISILLIVYDGHFLLNQQKFKLHFLNIGQGDAILMRSPTNCSILIDGGPPNTLVDSISKYLPPLQSKIDLVILTHPHMDHMGGLIQVLERYKVEKLWMTGVGYPSAAYDQFKSLVGNVEYVTAASKYNLCGIKLEILFPFNIMLGEELENVNNSSIVLVATINDHQVWLSGDAELEEEAELLNAYDLSRYNIEIFKAGHHGSRTSSSAQLLDTLNPKIMVIQSGEGNTYLHPHPETLQKAFQRNIKVYRNDLNGTVTFFF